MPSYQYFYVLHHLSHNGILSMRRCIQQVWRMWNISVFHLFIPIYSDLLFEARLSICRLQVLKNVDMSMVQGLTLLAMIGGSGAFLRRLPTRNLWNRIQYVIMRTINPFIFLFRLLLYKNLKIRFLYSSGTLHVKRVYACMYIAV